MDNLKITSTKRTVLQALRPFVFFPAFILLVLTIVLNFVNYDAFLNITTMAKNFMVIDLGWIFSIAGIMSVIVMLFVYFSPLGEVRLGGEDAKPLLKKTSWFAITLCTTIAAGIMFWGTAEPIWHLAYPPESLGIEPMSHEAAKFAMETMYLHWTFVPYAIYAVPTIMFAFAYYNMKRSFSVGSQIAPLISSSKQDKINGFIDAVVLFTVATGIGASFGTGVMNMGGGLNALFGIINTKSLWVIITIFATIAFIISSGTGLMKGIRILSDINVYLYYVIIAILLVLGPSVYNFSLGTEAFGGFLDNLFSKALFTGAAAGDTWAADWTMFYWANWMAWAPVSAVFLARIAYGYKIKEVVTMNFVIPSIFSAIWMTILSGTTINFQMTGRVDVLAIMNEQGSGAAAYAVLREFPLSGVIIGIYLIAVIISFITATDSTTNAMASICTTGISDGSKEAPLLIKITWGIIVGAVSLIFTTTLGIDGIKMLSYLGGFPALFLGVLSIVSLFVIMGKPEKYDFFTGAKKGELTEDNVEVNMKDKGGEI
ncbi:BCCT family transporter [Clostridium sp. ZS2-4]|uniref:BCCT family transporter n=1 Tax=Clostridium sp. ZS2-4 TaxID=2987703 RepID=UPI00227C101B|nr:BCCT family transporter [Clostridium sp. ZS2-4]MCY6354221.1 BCCT family transporter [Clostridium sp. ZS2-4]